MNLNLFFGLKCKQMGAVFKDMQQWSDEDVCLATQWGHEVPTVKETQLGVMLCLCCLSNLLK